MFIRFYKGRRIASDKKNKNKGSCALIKNFEKGSHNIGLIKCKRIGFI